MRKLFLLMLAVGALGCQADVPPAVTQLQTIESVPVAPPVLDPPPVLKAEAAPIPKRDLALGKVTPGEEVSAAPRVELPFAPAIAMDPVNGSKVSIRANTPIFEYKKKLYYFGSEANMKTFVADPEAFLKGSWTRY
ncbi:MAG TPA: hypothetical protein VNM92_13725 [Thermoanaerobaculia bacterium]|nr:hypothetical protein [Thermoanaerobaculia bacterium]